VAAHSQSPPGAFTALDDSRITRFQWKMVLGIRGRSPAAGLLLGSVSQTCAASASCPVVLVKRPGG
jgi:hypothetical protein